MIPIIRPAGIFDAGAMAELLNEIITIGGTTAITSPVSRAEMRQWLTAYRDRSVWTVAEDQSGTLLGFQWIEPNPNLPPEACDIATFVRTGRTGLGTGSLLFETTKVAARVLGYDWINATIRADNSGGLAYYQSRSFETYNHVRGETLDGGQIVDRISKRYDLTH
ncbi:GNAT family N-acetyltransferase [Shimia abyssi]|uniref:L-amino acid N-acyltransferase YncA n=1 Tax=Shimia abyssi TaxID=1662395 RepID=A0A2P8F895_9RHOB|nr:GNAT family N-acetyltransferase [Shimia abyssi]PSL17935.1 L-amino acid N-acyltransferase YncA [Shimia abyssi]